MLARSVVHGNQSTRQAGIREPGDETGAHPCLQGVIEQPAHQLDHNDFEDPIDQQPLAAAHSMGFVK